jgi:hypothetical protein
MAGEGDDETMHPADAAAERSTIAAGDWSRAKADGDDDGRARALRAYRAARMVGRAFARPEYRHPAATDPDFRGPTVNETAAEDADDWTDGRPRPDTVYRFDEGGSIPPRAYCGRCILSAAALDRSCGYDFPHAAVGSSTAARCEACDLDGAPARWATATRGASLWRALLVGLDGTEVDPLTGHPWAWGIPRPGMPSAGGPGCAGTWAAIISAADLARQPAGR